MAMNRKPQAHLKYWLHCCNSSVITFHRVLSGEPLSSFELLPKSTSKPALLSVIEQGETLSSFELLPKNMSEPVLLSKIEQSETLSSFELLPKSTPQKCNILYPDSHIFGNASCKTFNRSMVNPPPNSSWQVRILEILK